jgi:hypothetical protein
MGKACEDTSLRVAVEPVHIDIEQEERVYEPADISLSPRLLGAIRNGRRG